MAGPEINVQEVYELSGYAKSIAGRTQQLAATSMQIYGDLESLGIKVDEMKGKAKIDMVALKGDVARLKTSVAAVQRAMIMMVADMKNTIKKEDFARIEKRIDTWSPHALVSRREAERIVGKMK